MSSLNVLNVSINVKIKSVIPTQTSESLLEGQYDGYVIEVEISDEMGVTQTLVHNVTTAVPFEHEYIPQECAMEGQSLLHTIVDRLRAIAAF